MNRTISIGAIGTSSIMEYILQGIGQTEGLHCQVVCSRDSSRGAAFAQKNGVPESTDNLDAMLQRKDLDVIYIASPNRLHPDQAIRAMDAGKHVFVEKPAAVRKEDLQAMIDAARRNHVFFFECITTIFMPTFVKWMTDLHALGKIRKAEFYYGQYSSRYDAYLRGENPNNFNPDMDGGALNDLGVYCVHSAVALFGSPESVSYTQKPGPNGVDLAGVLTMNYPDFPCIIHTAKDRPMDSGCAITAERGTFVSQGPVNAFADTTCTIDGNTGIMQLSHLENRMIYEFARFRDAICNHDQAFFEAMCRQSLLTAGILEQAHLHVKNSETF